MPSSRAIPDREARGGAETILLVEDEAFVREVTGEVLEAVGYMVLKAANAEQAMKVYRQHPGVVDLLVTDLCMPGKNGRALAAELGTLCPRMKTILVSGYGDSGQGKDGNSGFTYFPKPFSADSLMRKIREVLDGYSAADWGTVPIDAEALASR
jgi:two-component system, cell cycle sensor histidine kinase and response regulator CckA